MVDMDMADMEDMEDMDMVTVDMNLLDITVTVNCELWMQALENSVVLLVVSQLGF